VAVGLAASSPVAAVDADSSLVSVSSRFSSQSPRLRTPLYWGDYRPPGADSDMSPIERVDDTTEVDMDASSSSALSAEVFYSPTEYHKEDVCPECIRVTGEGLHADVAM